MTKSNMNISRRGLLKASGAGLAQALGVTSLSALAPITAQAQSGYRALVCLFLYGGNDGNNMIVPTDSRYDQYNAVRGGSIGLPRNSLVNLSGVPFGLHPAMASLQSVWNEGALAPIFNVGPIHSPMTKEQLLALSRGDARLPNGLYSHSDQQTLWTAAGVNSTARTGWGGRAADNMGMTNPVMSFGGSGLYGLSDAGAGLSLPSRPGSTFGLQGYGSWSVPTARRSALENMYANASESNKMLNALIKEQNNAFDVADRLGSIIGVRRNDGDNPRYAAIDAAFEPYFSSGFNGGLGNQLYMIARMVMDRGVVQGNRQIFMAAQGGYDTHNGQGGESGSHQRLLESLAMGMSSFYAAMKAIGMQNAVTLFTQSDFGRTFKPNASDGTDHAWGNHHLIMGGAVNGRQTYGQFPQLEILGPNDHGVNQWQDQGRWIPTTSVEQYSASLLRWMGASPSTLGSILPGLSRFPVTDLGIMGA
ncbi:DUF1501 domain-containing protein [Hydrogenophaga sp. 5NK40-0174]|uniref:DUF1501 domain-containing protein n=1 Tax=Hydrogenophaga sp. 5NK40-0174 TaxID=3127649 RepID=UPI00310ABA60